ncbi:MAG: hypothetical protein VX399_07005 [SAR324 cluster bacterium]|nr:hypothetical protein [SAR324 cluster bacterium]
MKRPLHLILDSHFNPGVSLFWRRHGLQIMEKLVPSEFAHTNRRLPLEKLLSQSIWSGWKKIILMGNPTSIQRGFNVLMQAGEECRNSLEVGFWPLHWQDIPLQMMPRFSQVSAILQVFKAGHTLPVDVIRAQYHTQEIETSYHWNELRIGSSIANADTRILLDGRNLDQKGYFQSRVLFHEEELSSLTLAPGQMTKPLQMKFFLVQSAKTDAAAGKFQQWIQPLCQQEELLGTGRHLGIQGNWANLNLYDADAREPVQKIELEIIRRAFPLIIPSVPIRQRENVKAKLFSFEPRGAVAAQRESIKSRFHRRKK